MSVMDRIFNRTPAPVPVPATVQGGNKADMNLQPGMGVENNNVTAPNGTVPANSGAAPVVPESPLDAFKTLWEPNKDKDGKEIPPTDPTKMFNIDPAALRESAVKIDFSKVLK